MSAKPSIVFCHGLWADGSCFSKLIPTLRAEGHECITAEYGLDSLQGDVDCTIRALGRVSSPAILVGHSCGGTVITAAGTDDRVVGLVYLCALAPDETETSQSQQDKFPGNQRLLPHRGRRQPRLAASIRHRLLLRGPHPRREGDRLGDLDVPGGRPVQPEGARHCLADEPSAYIVGAHDNTVNPELERAAAERMGATTYEIDSDHVPMMSQPETVLTAIRNLVNSCQEALATA